MKGINYIIQEKFDWAIISLLVLALTIGLTPSFSIGTIEGLEKNIEVRGEDIWIVILALIWIFSFLKLKQQYSKPPLFLPIMFWLGIGFLSLLTNFLLGNLNVVRSFFYFAKELQFFFVYFFVFFHFRKSALADIFFRLWLGIGFANIAWVFWQLLVIGRRGEYGTSALAEWGVFPTATFFLLLFVFLFNWWLYYFWQNREISKQRQYIYLAAILLIIFGILGALSKTVFIGFWLALFLSMFLYSRKKKTLKTIFYSALLFAGVSIFAISVYFFAVLPNLAGAERYAELELKPGFIEELHRTRLEVIISQYQETIGRAEKTPLLWLIGNGKGAILLSQESHNQYLRNFAEGGMLGSIAFLILVISIIFIAWKKFKEKSEAFSTGLAAGLIVATLIMLFLSLPADAFIVVKPNMVYWFFAGLIMAILNKNGTAKTKRN